MKNWIVAAALAIVLLSSCEKEHKDCPGSIEKTFSLNGFTKIKTGETFQLKVIQGNDFSIKASGCENDLNDLSLSVVDGGFLEIKYKNPKKDRYHVYFTITMPEIITTLLSGVAKAEVNGFEDQDRVTRVYLSGAAEQRMDGAPADVQIDISGASKLTIKGSTENLKGMISGAGVLQAYETQATDVDIATAGTAKAYVLPLQNLIADASGASNIYYKGNPVNKDLSTSGAGKITKE
jgi:hypothetical protein